MHSFVIRLVRIEPQNPSFVCCLDASQFVVVPIQWSAVRSQYVEGAATSLKKRSKFHETLGDARRMTTFHDLLRNPMSVLRAASDLVS